MFLDKLLQTIVGSQIMTRITPSGEIITHGVKLKLPRVFLRNPSVNSFETKNFLYGTCRNGVEVTASQLFSIRAHIITRL